MATANKRLIGILLGVGSILLIHFIVMRFTAEVNWSGFDFMIMGVLLLGAGLLCELVLRNATKLEHRIGLCLALLTALFLIWAELAVGLFGTPFAGN